MTLSAIRLPVGLLSNRVTPADRQELAMASPTSSFQNPSAKAAARHLLKAVKRLDTEAIRRCRAQYADLRAIPDVNVPNNVGLMRCQHVIAREQADHPWFASTDPDLLRVQSPPPARHITTTTGKHVSYHLWEGSDPHFIVVGASDTLKRSFVLTLLDENQNDPGSQIFILDPGPSSAYRTRAILGSSQGASSEDDGVVLTGDPSQPGWFNPCAGSLDHVSEFIYGFVQRLISLRLQRSLTALEVDVVNGAIRQSYANATDEVFLHSIAHQLETAKAAAALVEGLRPFHSDGIYAPWFDRPTSFDLSSKRFICFDTAALRHLNQDLHAAVASVVMHAIVMHSQRHPQAKRILLIDQGWSILSDPFANSVATSAMRVGRARHLALGCMTQVLTDFPQGSQSVLSMTKLRFFFGVSKRNIGHAEDMLELSESETEAFQTNVTTAIVDEAIFQNIDGVHAFTYAPSSWEYVIATDDAHDVVRRRELYQEQLARGLTRREAMRRALEKLTSLTSSSL